MFCFVPNVSLSYKTAAILSGSSSESCLFRFSFLRPYSNTYMEKQEDSNLKKKTKNNEVTSVSMLISYLVKWA